ncbi:hypothetical protein MMC11_001620 [Xylographa trunciseda]|nr:hypothetical protein [Xylographa trunciseda]
MFLSLATVCLAFARHVSSQNSSDISCPNGFRNANATGNASFAFYDQVDTVDPTFIWVYSVLGNSSDTALASLWLGAPSDINLSSTTNDFNACGIELSLFQNTIERGQTDQGMCEQTLDSTCTASLTFAAQNAAIRLMGEQMGQPIMSVICQQIASIIVAATKNATCAPYFPSVPSSLSAGNNGLCTVPNHMKLIMAIELTAGTCVLPVYPHLAFSGFGNIDAGLLVSPENVPYSAYDNAYRDVKAIFTVFTPPANVTRISEHSTGEAFLNCLRITNTSSSSRVAPTLPGPTNVVFPGTLTGGDIAGIVIGCVAGVAILAGVIYLLLRRRRRARQTAAAAALPSSEATKEKGGDRTEVDSRGVVEASAHAGASGRAERKGQAVEELQGTELQTMLQGDSQPIELGNKPKAGPTRS